VKEGKERKGKERKGTGREGKGREGRKEGRRSAPLQKSTDPQLADGKNKLLAAFDPAPPGAPLDFLSSASDCRSEEDLP